MSGRDKISFCNFFADEYDGCPSPHSCSDVSNSIEASKSPSSRSASSRSSDLAPSDDLLSLCPLVDSSDQPPSVPTDTIGSPVYDFYTKRDVDYGYSLDLPLLGLSPGHFSMQKSLKRLRQHIIGADDEKTESPKKYSMMRINRYTEDPITNVPTVSVHEEDVSIHFSP
eukprot:Selendium_serpulae@DN1025_c0_g2_i1.p1